MAKKKDENVDAYMEKLVHERKKDIELLRTIIQASDKSLTERVKWNAPSFCSSGDDRITFRLQPGDRVELVFHRGAKVRADTKTFQFDDPSGLIKWASTDRGVVAFESGPEIERNEAKLRKLVRAWLKATTVD